MRASLRKLKQQLLRIQLTERPVLVFGIRRGGSTILADMVAANRGVWFGDEPYAVYPDRQGYEIKTTQLPKRPHSAFFDLSTEEKQKFEHFSRQLLSGAYRCMGTARRSHWGSARRIALKILNAPWMLDDLLNWSGGTGLAMTRHPGAQMVSVLRQGWDFQVPVFAAHDIFLYKHFNDKQIAHIKKAAEINDPVLVALTDWILLSHPLRNATHPAAIKLKYEDMVQSPERMIHDILFQKCGLKETKRMLNIIHHPSGSKRMSTKQSNQLIENGDTEALLNLWRSKLDDRDIRRCQAVLDLFEIDDYRMMD